jgi:hypothetical protein
MSSYENGKDYWIKFWNHNPTLDNEDLQKQIGRTINKVQINPVLWELTKP